MATQSYVLGPSDDAKQLPLVHFHNGIINLPQYLHRLNNRLPLPVYDQTHALVLLHLRSYTIPLYVKLNLLHQKHLLDRKSTRLNSSHVSTSYAVFCSKEKNPASLIAQRTCNPTALPARTSIVLNH